MNKFLTLLAIIATSCIIAGLYGILHDQITYTISEEYYTRFKFFQFGFCSEENSCLLHNPRIYAGIVGLLATWWTGIPIGLGLGLAGWRHHTAVKMFRIAVKAILLVLGVTLISGLIGLAIGYFYLAEVGVSWNLPENLEQQQNYIAVGSMHNFSYLGGLAGLVCGVVYILIKGRKNETL